MTDAGITFTRIGDTFRGIGERGREWLICPSPIGWRLEFTDPGDDAATYAGTYADIWAARKEAART